MEWRTGQRISSVSCNISCVVKNVVHSIVTSSLKWGYFHILDTYVTGCSGNSKNNNIQCSQWKRFGKHDSSFSGVCLNAVNENMINTLTPAQNGQHFGWHIQMHFLDIRISAEIRWWLATYFICIQEKHLKSRSYALTGMTLHFPCYYRGGLSSPEEIKNDMKSECEIGEVSSCSLWCHEMEILWAIMALCERNLPVISGFP